MKTKISPRIYIQLLNVLETEGSLNIVNYPIYEATVHKQCCGKRSTMISLNGEQA